MWLKKAEKITRDLLTLLTSDVLSTLQATLRNVSEAMGMNEVQDKANLRACCFAF